MAYDPRKLRLASGGLDGPNSKIDGFGPRIWTLESDDTSGATNNAGYITDAHSRGMRVGDVVFVTRIEAGSVTACYIYVVMAIASSGAADLSNGQEVGTGNSD